MDRDIKREILEYIIQNDFYRRVLFESDYNKYKEGYIKKLEQIKEKKETDLYSIIKDKDITKNVLNMPDTKTIENEAMIEFILSDSELTEFILKVLEKYLNIGVEIPEVVYLKDMPKDLLEGIINRNIKPLTPTQQKYLKEIEEHDYNITMEELAKIMGATRTNTRSMIKRIENRGYDIINRMNSSTQLREKQDKLPLTPTQQKYLKEIEEHNYNITREELAKIMGVTSSNVSHIIAKIEEKGYNIRNKMNSSTQLEDEENKPLLTSKQRKCFREIKEHNYNITITELARITGTSPQNTSSIVKRMNEKGYNIRIKGLKNRKKSIEYKEAELLPKQKMLLNIYSEKGYSTTQNDIAKIMEKHISYIPIIINGIILRFSKYRLPVEDTAKVIDLIKNKRKFKKLLEILKNSKKINYDNISSLIDELLQSDGQDKNNEINFVIDYEQILMNRGLERVEEPLYQLLVKHKVKLNNEQCKRVAELMDEYEKRIKTGENHGNSETVEELQSEEQEEMEL